MKKDHTKSNTTTENLIEFGERLKEIRKRLKMNQLEFAKSIDLPITAISEIESGRNKPGYDFFMNLVNIHKVNFNYLAFGQGAMFLRLNAGFDAQNREIREIGEDNYFFYYFKHSMFVKHQMLYHFHRLMAHQGEVIGMELKQAMKDKETSTP
ncbi:MAG: helix-turn-helix domain-containing protein [Candidatus Omnitrophota bacterium]